MSVLRRGLCCWPELLENRTCLENFCGKKKKSPKSTNFLKGKKRRASVFDGGEVGADEMWKK